MMYVILFALAALPAAIGTTDDDVCTEGFCQRPRLGRGLLQQKKGFSSASREKDRADGDASDATADRVTPGYINFGIGNCINSNKDLLAQESPTVTSRSDCQQHCDNRTDCHAYQFSLRSYTCKIFLEEVTGMDGRPWQQAQCMYKNDKYQNVGKRMCVGEGAPPYPQINAGIIDFSACIQKCTEDVKCFGFSRSRSVCYLWQSPITGAGGIDYNGVGKEICYKKKELGTYQPPEECSQSKPKLAALSAPEIDYDYSNCYFHINFLQKKGPETPCRVETYQVEVVAKLNGKSTRFKTKMDNIIGTIDLKKKHHKSVIKTRVRYRTLDGKVWSKWSGWSNKDKVQCSKK